MCNGFKNYETFAVSVWIDNDRDLYDMVQEELVNADMDVSILARRLEEIFRDNDNVDNLGGLYHDLLTNALNNADWLEVATKIIEAHDNEDDVGPQWGGLVEIFVEDGTSYVGNIIAKNDIEVSIEDANCTTTMTIKRTIIKDIEVVD